MLIYVMFIDERVDIVEAYTLIRKHLPVGTVIPVKFRASDGAIKGLVLGHVLKNLRKTPKTQVFGEICMPIFLHGRERYLCSLHSEDEKILGISTVENVFDPNSWKSDDYIVEIGSILP